MKRETGHRNLGKLCQRAKNNSCVQEGWAQGRVSGTERGHRARPLWGDSSSSRGHTTFTPEPLPLLEWAETHHWLSGAAAQMPVL